MDNAFTIARLHRSSPYFYATHSSALEEDGFSAPTPTAAHGAEWPLFLADQPRPIPWRGVAVLVDAAIAQELASSLEAGDTRSRIMEAADHAIEAELDEICGTPPHIGPGPWPGPSNEAIAIASELTLLANTLQAGGLRERISELAGRIVQTAYGAKAAKTGKATRP